MREGGKRGKGVLIVIISTYRNNAREDGLTSNGGDFGWNKSIYNKSTGDEYRREMRLSSFLSFSFRPLGYQSSLIYLVGRDYSTGNLPKKIDCCYCWKDPSSFVDWEEVPLIHPSYWFHPNDRLPQGTSFFSCFFDQMRWKSNKIIKTFISRVKPSDSFFGAFRLYLFDKESFPIMMVVAAMRMISTFFPPSFWRFNFLREEKMELKDKQTRIRIYRRDEWWEEAHSTWHIRSTLIISYFSLTVIHALPFNTSHAITATTSFNILSWLLYSPHHPNPTKTSIRITSKDFYSRWNNQRSHLSSPILQNRPGSMISRLATVYLIG